VTMANKKRKCKQCGEYKLAEEGIKTPLSWFCCHDHAVLFAQDKQAKHKQKQITKANQSQAKKEKAARADLIARKEKLKTAGDYIKEAQAAVNKYIRIRDHGKPCISCGYLPVQKAGGTIDAGHYRSRGAASHLRFNVLNIHAQCVKCNRFNSGNAIDYRINLIKKIGVELVDKLEADNQPRKFTIEYLKIIKRIFNKRANWYSKRKGRN